MTMGISSEQFRCSTGCFHGELSQLNKPCQVNRGKSKSKKVKPKSKKTQKSRTKLNHSVKAFNLVSDLYCKVAGNIMYFFEILPKLVKMGALRREVLRNNYNQCPFKLDGIQILVYFVGQICASVATTGEPSAMGWPANKKLPQGPASVIRITITSRAADPAIRYRTPLGQVKY